MENEIEQSNIFYTFNYASRTLFMLKEELRTTPTFITSKFFNTSYVISENCKSLMIYYARN